MPHISGTSQQRRLETALAIGFALIYAIAWILVGTVTPLPASEDMGFQIQISDQLRGHDYRGYSTSNPPVYFLLLRGLRALLPPFVAAYVLVQVSAALLGLAMFRFLRDRLECGWAALVGMAALSLSPGIVQMTAWGAGPNLLAMAFWLLASAAALKVANGATGKSASVELVIFTAASAGSHLPTAALLAITHVCIWIASPLARVRLANLGVISILVAMVFLPWYVRDLGDLARPFGQPSFDGWITEGIRSVYREQVYFWASLTVLSLIGYAKAFRQGRNALAIWGFSAIGFSIVTSLSFWSSLPSRAAYYGYIAILPGALLAICANSSRPPMSWRRTFAWFIVALMAIPAVQDKADATRFYGEANDDLLLAGNYIEAHSTPSDNVLTVGKIAWRTGAASHRFVFSANDPIWLQFNHERQDAVLSNMLYKGALTLRQGDLYVSVHSHGNGSTVDAWGVLDGRVVDLWTANVTSLPRIERYAQGFRFLDFSGDNISVNPLLAPTCESRMGTISVEGINPANRAKVLVELTVEAPVPVVCGTLQIPARALGSKLVTMSQAAANERVEGIPESTSSQDLDSLRISWAVVPKEDDAASERFMEDHAWTLEFETSSYRLFRHALPKTAS